MGFGVIRLDGKGPAITRLGLREPALLPEDVAQVVMRFRVIRLDGKGPAITGFGLREPALLPEGVAQVVMGFGVIRLDGEGLTKLASASRAGPAPGGCCPGCYGLRRNPA